MGMRTRCGYAAATGVRAEGNDSRLPRSDATAGILARFILTELGEQAETLLYGFR